MSESKQCSQATNILSFLQNTSISFPETEQKVYDTPRTQGDLPCFNDSNSDDTQFEIQSGDHNSNDTSPVKANTVLEQNRYPDSKWKRRYAKQDSFVPYRQQTSTEKIIHQNKSAPSDNKDATSFVDYFLAHDDLLEALDDYSRSVGETSVFPLEMAPALSAGQNQYSSPKDLCNPLATIQTTEINVNQTKNIATNDDQFHSEIGSNRPPQIKNYEKTEILTGLRGKDRVGAKQTRPKTGARRSEKRKPRTYSHAIPSQHCHICSRRPTATSPHAVCGNLLKGRCRKTICTKCFHQFRWDLKAAREAPPGTWECPHCRGECPQRAQCVIYNRTSDRRRMKLINHRKKKDQPKASTIRKDLLSSNASRKTECRAESPDSGTTTMNVFVTPNSSSSMENIGRPSSPLKYARKNPRLSGVSKPVRTSGISQYAQFFEMGDEMAVATSEEKLENEWDGSELLATTGMPLQELRPKAADIDEDDDVKLKREVGLLRDNILDVDGGDECEDMMGMFCSMVDASELNTADGTNEKETNMGVDTSLGLLDIKESFETKNEESKSQEKLNMWTADTVKYEETEEETFILDDTAVADLDSMA